ncbi:MAG: hypothetical protein ACI849_000449 [Patiriisocius sp.]|jgi:hypothetical protein
MLSKEKQFIFIHNFKTGGTSIEKKLGHFDALSKDVQDHRTIKDFERLTQRATYAKLSAYALKKGKSKSSLNAFKNMMHPELTKSQYNSYFKFTFVRNTWARMYSWYRNVMKDPMMRASYNIIDTNLSFDDFLTTYIEHNTFSQLYFITDTKGNVPMDFIGKFENLQEDFNYVCEKLAIEDSTLPKLLVRNYSHYSKNYTDKTKDLIYKLYKEEIDYFKFEF